MGTWHIRTACRHLSAMRSDTDPLEEEVQACSRGGRMRLRLPKSIPSSDTQGEKKTRYPACWRKSIILPSLLFKLLVLRDGTVPYRWGTAASMKSPSSSRTSSGYSHASVCREKIHLPPEHKGNLPLSQISPSPSDWHPNTAKENSLSTVVYASAQGTV